MFQSWRPITDMKANWGNSGGGRRGFIPPEELLPHLPSITITPGMAREVQQGRTLHLCESAPARWVKLFIGPGELIAIAERTAGVLYQPRVVLTTQHLSA